MEKMKRKAMILCMLIAIGGISSSAFALDGLSYNGSTWPAVQLNANNYVALASLSSAGSGAVVANQFFGARAGGGIDVIANYGGPWGTYLVGTGTYVALARNYGVADYVFGANAAGGVDAVYNNGGWTTGQVNDHNFASLANINVGNQFMGVRTDGRLEFTYYDGTSWPNYLVGTSTDLYKQVIFDPMNANSVYAIRNFGGIDRLTFNGSVWVKTEVDYTHSYVALTADKVVANLVYGATAGGLYGIGDYGGGFTPTKLNTTSYKALEDVGGGAFQLFGSRADGTGMDAIYYNGTWNSYLANPNNYSVLLHDVASNNLFASLVLTHRCVNASAADLDHDCFVNFNDMAIFAADWLKCGFDDGVCP